MPSGTTLRFPPPPSPPPSPCPWLWRCHSCHIWYRLATTRRCLECDHYFCLSDTATARSSTKKRKRSGGPCRAEYDYIGWAARGAWRRTLLLNAQDNTTTSRRRVDHFTKAPRRTLTPASACNDEDDDKDQENEGGILLGHRRWLPKSSLTKFWGDEHRALEHGIEQLTDRFAEKKEALQVRRKHNCWLHCDFPSECHHAIYKAQQEGRPVLAKARALDRAYLAKVKEEEDQLQRQQQQQQQFQAILKGPSGLRKGFEKERDVRRTGGDTLRRDLLMSFSGESSESDTSDSEDFDDDDDVDVDDLDSLPGSPPTEDEVLQSLPSQQSVVTSPILSDDEGRLPIRMSFDMEKDYSYSTFKKATGIEPPLNYISSIPPKTSHTFEIHVDDDATDSALPVEATTTTSSTNLPSFHTFEPFWTSKKSSTSHIATSRERSTAPLSPTEPPATTHINTTPPSSTNDQLEQAYSSQAWFSPSTFTSFSCPAPPLNEDSKTENNTPPTTKNLTQKRRRHRAATTSSSRTENTARMLTLLGRRISLPPSSAVEGRTIAAAATISIFEAWEDDADI